MSPPCLCMDPSQTPGKNTKKFLARRKHVILFGKRLVFQDYGTSSLLGLGVFHPQVTTPGGGGEGTKKNTGLSTLIIFATCIAC